jgi:glycosyltransferase 2 family protein
MSQSNWSTPTIKTRKPIRGSLVWWLRLMGVLTFLILIFRLPTSEDVRLSHIDLRWLGLCMILTLVQVLLDSSIWQWLLAKQNIRHAYTRTIQAQLASQYLGFVTPGRVGEFLAAGYISMNTGITVGYALSSVVMKKILGWMALLTFGLWGLPILSEITDMSFSSGVGKLVWISVAVFITLSVAIFIWVLSLRQLAKKWQKLSPWQIDMTEFRAGIKQLISLDLILPFLLALFSFSIFVIQLYAILKALGIITLSFVTVSRIVGLSRVAARLLPISIAGFGAKDAAVIWLLSQYAIDPTVGFTATLLFLVCSYVVMLLLSAVSWWIKPLIVRKA